MLCHKFLSFKVGISNPTIKNLEILNFIIIIIFLTQVINNFSKIWQNEKNWIYGKIFHALGIYFLQWFTTLQGNLMTSLERWNKRTDVWFDMIPFVMCGHLMCLPLLGCGCRHFCSKVDAKTICIMEHDSNPHKWVLYLSPIFTFK